MCEAVSVLRAFVSQDVSVSVQELHKQPVDLTLDWQVSYVTKMTCKPSKLGQTDLVYWVCD